MALAAIFLMSQVPTMVNGLAGTVVATASGIREARQLAGGAAMAYGGGKAVARAAHPTAAVLSSAVGAARATEGGMVNRGKSAAQEMIDAYVANKQSRERNQKRMANMGRRTSFGDDLEAGRAGVMQFTRERKRERRRQGPRREAKLLGKRAAQAKATTTGNHLSRAPPSRRHG